MTRRTLLFVLFSLALVLVGCTGARSAILGTWQGEGEARLQFLADGTLILIRTGHYQGIGPYHGIGTYQFIGDTSVRTDLPSFYHGIQTGSSTQVWEVSTIGDNLTLSSAGGEVFTFTRVK